MQLYSQFILLILSTLLFWTSDILAQVSFVSSGTGGDWSLASTWGNAGVPGNNDHAIISSGTVVSHGVNEIITRIEIESGGELQSNARLTVRGSYTNDGLHSGTGRVQLQGTNDTIAGSGTITTTSIFRVDNERTIISGANLTRTGQNLRSPNNATLFNFGTLTIDRGITGNGTTTFYNGTGATLNIQRALVTNGTLIASDLNNTINYNRTGSNNADIKEPFDGYYNLHINGNNINSDKRITSDILVLNDLVINGSTLFQVNGTLLSVGGDFILNNGDYLQNQGILEFNGTSPQLISGEFSFNDVIMNSSGGVSITPDTVRLTGHMTVPTGTLNANGLLVIESTVSNDAGLGEIGPTASVNGDVKVNRLIPGGATDWRFMGSPISNATFEDWDDDFVTSGFPGSDFPNFGFTSIYGYDETVTGHQDSGFFKISGSDIIEPGKGYWVFCGDSLGGTNPFVVDVAGPINQGIFDFGVTFTSTTGLEEDGWNLVSNPYPCAIDWDAPAWTKVNMDSAIYVWNTNQDQYASYTNGVGVNGGSNIIPIGQAFFVKANLPLTSLIAEEAVKYDTTVAFLRNKHDDDLVLRLKLVQNNDYCESVIRVNNNATNQFDGGLGAYHFPGFGDNKTDIYSIVGDKQLSINAVPVNDLSLIPLRVSGNAGAARLEYQREIVQDDFCLILWNTLSNEQTILEHTGSVELELDTDSKPSEFILLMSRNAQACDELLHINETELEINAEIYYSNGRVYNKSVANQAPYTILDANGSLVQKGYFKDQSLNVEHLPAGVYFFVGKDEILKFSHQ